METEGVVAPAAEPVAVEPVASEPVASEPVAPEPSTEGAEAAQVELSDELEAQLKEVGKRLTNPPEGIEELVALLDKTEGLLVKVDQSPSETMSEALKPVLAALVAKDLFSHANVDVMVSVAACISEITRVTAPEAPYDDDVMKDVFQKIVAAFENMDDVSSALYRKRVNILDTVAKVRSCVVMLDLECDDLILEMFTHFFKNISTMHQESVFRSMETILSLVIDESEDVPPKLVTCLLQSVKKDMDAQTSFKLGEKVILNCAEKLKPFLADAVKGTSLNEYSKVVSTLLHEGSDKGDNEANSSQKDKDEDSKFSDRTVSDELPQGSEKSEQDVCSPKVDDTSSNKTLPSNGATAKDNGERLTSSVPVKNTGGRRGRPPKSKGKPKLDASDRSGTASKNEKLSSSSAKQKSGSHQTTEAGEEMHVDQEEDTPRRKSHAKESGTEQLDVPSGNVEPPEDAEETVQGNTLTDAKSADIMSEDLPDTARPRKGRPPKSLGNKARNQAGEARKAAVVTPNSEVKSLKLKNMVKDVDSSKKKQTADGELSKKKQANLESSKKNLSNAVELSKKKPNDDIESSKKKLDDAESSKKKQGDDLESSKKKPTDGLESSKKKPSNDSESSKKKPMSFSKRKEETVMDDADAEDISLKEIVSTKSAAKALGKNKNILDSSGSKQKRGLQSEEISEPKRSRVLDGSLVGARIKVWWPDDKAYYDGTVDSYDPASKRHKIQYDDGDTEILVLKKEKWEYIRDIEGETDKLLSPDVVVGKANAKGKMQVQKEEKIETPKSGVSNTTSGEPPKRKGWPKGVPRSKPDGSATPGQSKGKADTEKLQGSKGSMGKDSSAKPIAKSKDESVGSDGISKEDSVKRGKRSRDGMDKSADKSEDAPEDEGKETKKLKVSASEEVPLKAKGTEGSNPNGASKKGRLLKSGEGEKSDKSDSAAGKAQGSDTSVRKRGRKALD